VRRNIFPRSRCGHEWNGIHLIFIWALLIHNH
jgi:hypothetical protein